MSNILDDLCHHDPTLARELDGIRTLEHLLDWFQWRGLSLANLELIAQDEYSHDLITPLNDGRWMSFAVT